MGVIEKAVEWALKIANDNTHGYSQSVRWGPSYDCSSLVISAFEQAGLQVKEKGATYTGNMKCAFMACGFECLYPSFTNCSQLKYGDVLLNYANHTAIYIGDGQIVHARSSEGTSNTSDDSGNEIRTQAYWNYPWDCVLRYKGDSNTTKATTTVATAATASNALIPANTKGVGVAAIQGMLKYLGYSLGAYGVDGDSGSQYSYTNIALQSAVSKKEISKDTIEYLLKLN